MNIKCFVPQCTNKLCEKCNCDENTTFFCLSHAGKHLESQSETKKHQLLKLYYTPIQETKILFKKKISELRKGLQQLRASVILATKEIIEIVEKNAEKTLESLSIIDDRLSKLNLLADLNDLSSYKDPEHVLKMEPDDAEYEIGEWHFTKFNSNSDLVASHINSYFDISLNPFQPPVLDKWNMISDNEYIFFKNKGKELSQINLKTCQETKFALNLAEDIHYQISSCILPNKSVFYCANPVFWSSGYTFIIDKDKNIKKLAPSKPNRFLYPVYHDGFVYAIGGRGNLAEKYCLETNKWQSCAPLPTGLNFHQTGSVLFNTEILLTGFYLTNVIQYSTKSDTYSYIVGLNLVQSCKTLFKGNKKVYILEQGGNIFESGEKNISIWNSVGTNNINPSHFPTNYVVEHNGSIYMIFSQNQLWEFKLSTRELRLIKTYN